MALQIPGQQATQHRCGYPPPPVFQPVHRFPQGSLEQIRGSYSVDLGRVFLAPLALTVHIGLGARVAEGGLQAAEAVDTPAAQYFTLIAASHTMERQQ